MPPDLQNTVQQIAQALGETERTPQRQLQAVTRTLSIDVALQLLQDTQAIEAQGGLLTTDGSRRRTPGGVFFQLARQQMTPEQRRAVFGPFKHTRSHVTTKVAHAATPAAPSGGVRAPSWAERGPLIEEAQQQPGEIRTVKVTIIGRPGTVIERSAFTLLKLIHAGPLPALPKGIPVPATVPTTTYVVYIGAKHWRGVAAAIQNPEDALIVEGTQIYDAEFAAIAVFATNVTTRLLQQAKRQQER